jgi:Fe(II)/alpha-ketoglutarate-dependent arginine beta-hydroxylase
MHAIQRFALQPRAAAALQALSRTLATEYGSAEAQDFLDVAGVLAHDVPVELRQFLHAFKTTEPSGGVCLVSGCPVDESRIGPTPGHWLDKKSRQRTVPEEMLFVLLSSLLGEVFGWAAQQNGRIIHEVMPIRGNEQKQLGTGSEQPIWWHTEDAFHEQRGDYVGLMCLRNPDSVATTYASAHNLPLDARTVEILRQPSFRIRPDDSHVAEAPEKTLESRPGRPSAGAIDRILALREKPASIAVLFGPPDAWYIRADPFFMDLDAVDPEARGAMTRLTEAIDARIESVVLAPGDICFIDNYRAVHGRRPFKGRYDGSDRWLKRVNIARDLRRSRADRQSSTSRVVC